MYPTAISFAGAGKLATSLSGVLFNTGYIIDRIVSETEKSGKSLAVLRNSTWQHELIFPDTTNIIIVAVPDHKLEAVLSKIICPSDSLVVHTAGSFGLEVFPERIKHSGIFYPLQTFSKDRIINFKDLPVLIESSDPQSTVILQSIAESISGKVYFTSQEKRRILHIAAVFVSNFTNHLLTLGKTIAGREGFSFSILRPLIEETISKALEDGPENSQTGPAVRNDKITIEKHLELLSFSPELQTLYREMSLSIMKYHNKL